jgi:hypothetical protein
MTYDELLALKADFSGMDATQAEQKGRALFRSLYLDGDSPFGNRQAHDGQPVAFYLTGQHGFDHGFFTSSDLAGHPLRKDVLALNRLERLPWIGPVIRGEVQRVEYRKETFRRRQTLFEKRLYLLPQESYVVWLEPQMRGGFKFATAYTATPANLAEYRRKTLLVKVF